MKSISLQFDGYWAEKSAQFLPSQSGIYCVYGGKENPNGTVTINKLIYIGESENVRNRVSGHEKEPAWRRHLAWGEVLIFSSAPIAQERLRAEAALIFHHKPPVNDEYTSSFPYDETQMTVMGKSALLASSFTVRSTNTNRSTWGY